MKCLLALAACLPAIAATPIRLHPDNPHYFLFRGRPAVLVTSGEHYGAVLNLDFDYKTYLAELQRQNLNHTRTFAGTYREVPGSFSIGNNTLAPAPDRFLSPWMREGNRYDFGRWNPAYFARLKDFLKEASRREIVVELNLFCPFYKDDLWEAGPFHSVPRLEVFALKHAAITAAQVAFVRKVVSELRDFDNLYYEIANEPYFGGITAEWQRTISGAIANAETGFPEKHLISQNIANGSVRVADPDPLVSILNFHYSRPPESVAQNYDLKRAIGMNETGFDGSADATYRIQGWDFLLAGGALYNNLDYSFAVGHERGDYQYDAQTPGGGSASLRRQLGILRGFLNRLDFVRMAPAPVSTVAGDASARCLAEPGKTYAVYVHRGRIVKDAKPKYQVDATARSSRVRLDLPGGHYRIEWLDPKSGRSSKGESVVHEGGALSLETPEYSEDIALVLRSDK